MSQAEDRYGPDTPIMGKRTIIVIDLNDIIPPIAWIPQLLSSENEIQMMQFEIDCGCGMKIR